MAHALRLAEALQSVVVFVGTRPTAGMAGELDTYFKRWRSVQRRFFRTDAEMVRSLRAQGARVVALEVSKGASPYHQLKVRKRETLALVVGNEDTGLDDAFLKRAADQVYIPMVGKSSCLSVGMALAVAAYHYAYVAQDITE